MTHKHTEHKSHTAVQTAPAKPKTKPLPLYRVLLHNDDVNTMQHAVATVHMLTPLKLEDARQRTLEAHFKGLSLLLKIHKERAELYQDQFRSRGMIVSIEPDEK